jgi:hypothetical protein
VTGDDSAKKADDRAKKADDRAKKAIETYRRMVRNEASQSSDSAADNRESADERLLAERPPHWQSRIRVQPPRKAENTPAQADAPEPDSDDTAVE